MNNKAFSLIEMLVVMGIIASLMALSIPQLFRLRDRSTLQNATTKLVSLVRQQQLNAMNSPNLYGVNFDQDRYTLFTGGQYISTNSANTAVIFDYPIALTTIDIPSSKILFSSGSGELTSFSSLHNSITLEDIVHHEISVVQFNALGVPISIQ